MSQQKVDKYKQNKANRERIMKKKKVTRRIEIILVIAIVAAALVWFGVSVYNSSRATESSGPVYLDSEEVVNYMNGPDSYTPEDESKETEDAAESEETGDTAGSEESEDAAEAE